MPCTGRTCRREGWRCLSNDTGSVCTAPGQPGGRCGWGVTGGGQTAPRDEPSEAGGLLSCRQLLCEGAGATGRSHGQEPGAGAQQTKALSGVPNPPGGLANGGRDGRRQGGQSDAIAGIPWRDDGGRALWFGGGDEKCSDWVYSAGRAVRFANQMATRSNVAFISVTECIEIAF